MEEKVKIIDEIVKRHPSYGVGRGWSYYTGGMKDSGDWYFRKMLDEPLEVLRSFLIQLKADEMRPKKESPLSQEDLWKQFHDEIERRLLFGK